MSLVNKKENKTNKVTKAKNWVIAKKMIVSAYISAIICSLMTVTVYAEGETTAIPGSTTAEAKWVGFVDFIAPWITRIGGGTFLVGLIMFGLAWRNNDSESKGNAVNTMIGGGIILAVGASTEFFLL